MSAIYTLLPMMVPWVAVGAMFYIVFNLFFDDSDK